MEKINKWIVGILGLAVIFIAAVVCINIKFNLMDNLNSKLNVLDYLNMTYVLGSESFTLKNGVAEKAYAPYSASKNILRTFGEPVYGDLNADGNATDAALWLQNDPGGSGTFYYAVLIMNNNGIYKPTGTMLLGDRIAPQTVEIHDGRAVYNFAERRASEPMTTPPSIGRSVWVHYDVKANEIGEWVKDFDGEGVKNPL